MTAQEVWRNADSVLPRVFLSPEEPASDVLASLAYDTHGVRAFGDIIFATRVNYTLRLSARLLVMDDEAVRRILIHEAVHLGHPTHGPEFRQMVRQHGGAVSESSTADGKIQIQAKIGNRYRTVEFADTEAQAETIAREYRTANPGAKVRLQF